MEVLVRNAEGNLTERDREYASQKLGRLNRFFNQAQRVEIVHRESKQGHRIEVTVFADGYTIRGEETDESIRAAIDLVSDKLDQRLRRLKKRIHDSYYKRGHKAPFAVVEPEEEVPQQVFEIAERKQFLIKPMSVEEAALQLEMVDHSFFIFRNEENGSIEVLYRRKDGRYGLLQPEG
ncbi:MAG: ribosome-associated translation inhibitor RaiA [Armatimonadetes bacterium]|nr:ribosome-associated translation inhibitor RaiA [Armatimonadota bacterium]